MDDFYTSVCTLEGVMVREPTLVVFEPTNNCIQKCTKCLRTGSGGIMRNQGYLSLNDFALMLNKMPPSIEFIGLNGFGEPLLHPNFEQLLSIVDKYNPKIKLGFHTNGVLLNPNIMNKCLRTNVSDIEFSIDSNNTSTYKKLHPGFGSLEKVLHNISDFVEMRNNSQSKLRLGISFVLQKDNLIQLNGYVSLARDLGVDFVGPVVPINPFFGYRIDKSVENFENLSTIILEGEEYAKSKGVKYIYPSLNRNKKGSANIDPISEASCAFPFTLYPIITWDCYALPCVWIQDINHNTGNLKIQSFEEIWNGNKIKELRKRFLHSEYLSICENCRPGGLE